MQQLKRWITAVILIPFLLLLLFKGSALAISILISIVSVLAVKEYILMTPPADNQQVPLYIRIVSYIISAAIPVSAFAGSWQVVLFILMLDFILVALFLLFNFPSNKEIINIVAKQVMGIVYIPVSLSMLVFIHQMDAGVLWIIWLLIVVFANDTGAFYTGTFLGKRRLAPGISPKKTIEGSVGGVIVSIIAGSIALLIFFHDTSLILIMIPCILVLAVAGQAGDLFESALKRASGIKDSGQLLPGHGGMLDRIDNLLFTIPIIYSYLAFIS